MIKKAAVITGAGSGVGQAVAWRLAEAGWQVALVGRREQALRQTAGQAKGRRGSFLACPCDISDPAQVGKMAEKVSRKFGAVELLVNSAAVNIPDRSLKRLTLENYRQLLEINLTGPYLCAQAFLPSMRQRGSGTIVNIISEAGKQASAKSGAAYVMAKFGLTGFTQSLNAEERGHGIRACAIFPGDIDTALLDQRPEPPSAEARKTMLRADDVAQCVLLAVNLPSRAIVEEILIRPR